MRVLAESSEDEMVACFLLAELASERWGSTVRLALAEAGWSEQLLSEPDLSDERANRARRDLLGVTRGYGRGQDVFDADFPPEVRWRSAELAVGELAQVRYIEYSYWTELSGGSRLPIDAAARIRAGVRVFDVSNDRFERAAHAVTRGEQFPPLILAGPHEAALVCLEGNLRLTAYALAGFPREVRCLVGTTPGLERWAR